MKPDIITDQLNLLNINHYPFLYSELVKSFKIEIKRFHPDVYKEKDAHEKSIKINDAYKVLKQYASDYEIEKVKMEEEKLFEFKKSCDRCDGKGFEIIERIKHKYNCSKCKDSGYIKRKCKHCDNGKFKLKSGRIVDCKSCKGTGLYSLSCNHRISFDEQWREMYDNPYIEIKEKIQCEKCSGTGKIKFEPLNPVIRKGAVLK